MTVTAFEWSKPGTLKPLSISGKMLARFFPAVQPPQLSWPDLAHLARARRCCKRKVGVIA